MKKALPTACLGILGLMACVGTVGLALMVLVALVGVQFLATLLDEVTQSAHIPANSPQFYSVTGGSDFRRLPLLAPYQVLSIDNRTWSLALQTNTVRYQQAVGKIAQLAVIDKKIIVVYASDTLFSGAVVQDLWFVIAPAESLEQGFTDEQAFLEYLATAGVTAKPSWATPEQLYRTFVDEGYLAWFPEDFQKK